MKENENILDELRQISEFVANISRQTPYKLPDGYFGDLPGKVMDQIKSGAPEPGESGNQRAGGPESKDLSSVLLQIPRQPAFSVPAGYFEGFAEKLMARIKSGEVGETGEAAKTGDIGDEGWSHDPLEELAAISPLLSRIDKKTPFQAPEGYFNELAGNAMSGVQAIEFVNDELENLSPLLTSLQHKTVYQVPAGYFTDLADTILAKVKEQSGQAAVIPISKGRKWLKYSAAAIAAGLIVTAGWLGFHKAGTGSNDVINSLSKVSDREIRNYLENQNIPLAESVTNSTATLDINDSDVKNLLGDVPDDELKQYMEEHSAVKNMVTN